jgi:glycosyltransferase involved in cell wall biosynthesis
MTLRRILGLGTFPAVKPVHGGQRRAAAFRRFYESVGVDYVYTCIYDPSHYAAPLIGPHDIPLKAPSSAEAPVVLIGDYLSGRQGATDPASFRHFLNVVEQLKPDALQLEQPFMWPLAKRLRETLGAGRLPLIYSSYNVEAPLKDTILAGGGVAPAVRRQICDSIEQIEAEICREAALVVCVSVAERDHYVRYCAPEKVIVVPNGVDRPPPVIPDYAPCRKVFEGRRFMFMVGSAYGPNIEGVCRYVFNDGAFMVPPVKSIAICGGVSDGVFNHPLYQRFQAANSARVHFFAKIEDSELWAMKAACHVVALPIDTGGGSNLKTAEALTLGKWIVASKVAMRGYENYVGMEGLVIAPDSIAFRTAIARALRSAPPSISSESRKAREALYWDRCFGDTQLKRHISALRS